MKTPKNTQVPKKVAHASLSFSILVWVLVLVAFSANSNAGILISADGFAVLAGSTITNTNNTVINGDMGVYPGSAITGFGPGIVNGSTYAGGAISQQAKIDTLAGYILLVNEASIQDLSGLDLGGLTLTSGVRNFTSSALLTGTLTLDAGGDTNARFDFQIGSTLTTASNSVVLLINGAQASNVFWQVGTSATLGTNSIFSGSILADQSITLASGAGLSGRAIALNGAVTLDNNVITIPEPSTFWLLFCCSFFLCAWRRWVGGEGKARDGRRR